MADQLDVLKLVTARLEAMGVPYMLTGSVAAGLYGQPRMTRDLDIVAALRPIHAEKLTTMFDADFVLDRETVREAIAARRLFNMVHRETLHKIDFILLDEHDYELEKFDRRRPVQIGDLSLWVISPEDLVLSKLVWAKQTSSELQIRDVRGIIALQTPLDWPYMDRWAVRLTVAKQLKELRDERHGSRS